MLGQVMDGLLEKSRRYNLPLPPELNFGAGRSPTHHSSLKKGPWSSNAISSAQTGVAVPKPQQRPSYNVAESVSRHVYPLCSIEPVWACQNPVVAIHKSEPIGVPVEIGAADHRELRRCFLWWACSYNLMASSTTFHIGRFSLAAMRFNLIFAEGRMVTRSLG